MNWKLRIGDFLFKHRSFTPVPLIILVAILFKPVNLGENNIVVNVVGLAVSLLGEMIRVMTVGFSFPGTSGRETYLRADHLNSTGIYSVVRNPLYIGNFFMFSGIVIVFANIYAVVMFTVFLVGQYYFIVLSEENYLKGKYGKKYKEYCSGVRRIIPKLWGYVKNENPFNLKKVIFKEKDGIFNVLMMFLLVLLYKEWFFYGGIREPLTYYISGGLLILVYIIVKIVKKRHLRKQEKEL